MTWHFHLTFDSMHDGPTAWEYLYRVLERATYPGSFELSPPALSLNTPAQPDPPAERTL